MIHAYSIYTYVKFVIYPFYQDFTLPMKLYLNKLLNVQYHPHIYIVIYTHKMTNGPIKHVIFKQVI